MAARLVVMSACESGLVLADPANDPAGLVPSLLAAGVPGVLGTLWRVDAGATAEFMVAFYRCLVERSWWARKPDALRAAMKEMRKSHPSPYYWAPFILIGGGAVSTKEID